jgi:hypothetical protein
VVEVAILSGLIAWTWAWLLFSGRPEAAYEVAFRADFYDIGYAREAVALLAAVVSVGVVGNGLIESLYEVLISRVCTGAIYSPKTRACYVGSFVVQ